MQESEKRKDRAWLKKKLKIIMTGSDVDHKKLPFEQLYSTCYQLCLHRDGSRLMQMFYSSLKSASSVYGHDRDEFVRRSMMISDVFMFAVITRFGMHLNGDNNAKNITAAVWEGRRLLRKRI